MTGISIGDVFAIPFLLFAFFFFMCAMMLIGQCVESNAGTLTLNLEGHTHNGVETGDWVLTLRRKTKSGKRKDSPQ